jgi:cytochrome c oxidase subunit 2
LFDQLFTTYLLIAIVVAVLVFGAVAFALITRRRESPDWSTDEPRAGNTRLEVAFAVLIAALIAFLLVRTFSTGRKVDARPPAAETIRVTASQWGWRFAYPKAGFAIEGNSLRNPTLVVPAEREIAFTLVSRDVIHSFWIPAERFKRDAIPGRTNRFNLVFDSPQNTFGQCAEYCGLDHATMGFNVTVLEPAEFDRWLELHRSGRREEAAENPG